MSSKELFEEFMKKEYLSAIEICEVNYDCIPCVTVVFSDSGCCDHEEKVILYANDEIEFINSSCGLDSMQLLLDALKGLRKELGW